MKSEALLIVNLEITVPHIVLSATRKQSSSAASAPGEQRRETERIQLLAPDAVQPQVVASEGTERIAHAVKFCLFRLDMLEVGKPLLLQVLRRRNEERSLNQRRESNEGFAVTETSQFTLELRELNRDPLQADLTRDPQEKVLEAGINRVVVYLDNEGTPGSYSIDGAES
ncbi:MAG: hypothetical protein ACJ788_06685 [Ktedonobacteraceae bacterium]